MKNRWYHFFKLILVPIFKLYYNPKIINKKYITKDGPIIIVGNHIHIMDQCSIIASTKRNIHYMAKKEYFEGKFSGFFRLTGCISVDRSIHDDEAKNKAIRVLNSGEALSLFPEGTRNALKPERILELYKKYNKDDLSLKKYSKLIKNQRTSQINYLEELLFLKKITKEDVENNIFNVDSYLLKVLDNKEYEKTLLLDFKYGAVSMAKKTNATIIPFGVKGKYCFRSKDLVVTFGKPFKINDLELDEANKKLEQIIRDLID